ncbi:Polar-differentiation response regulator DivK [Candidatus Thermoflexus japonica]|uniref:Polar-differentiation response regulator DivK n=1 Tax=Candidatus Thermoflexus japonica TaxID=2035417 RepID=A0A2H5Y391_9CHLR|nr:Polar-differentiation response regulator DivK [Candidatus Thermoflexus japonica]
MIIEDDPQMARMLATLLEFEGYATVICPSPEQALDCIREGRPDVVVMDFYLGRARAPDFLQTLRTDPELRAARVIIVSGDDQQVAARAAGADRFLLKPFAVEELLEVIRDLIPPRQGGSG